MMSKKIYNRRYTVYEDGRVFSNIRNIYLKKMLTKHGYVYVRLSRKTGETLTHWVVHRLVATCFIPNPNRYPEINHIDGDKENNHISNLEWCTTYHNNKHARNNGLNNIPKSNSERWECPEFREKTSNNISKGVIKSGSNKGYNNPRAKRDIWFEGKAIACFELSQILDISEETARYIKRELRKGNKPERVKDCDIRYLEEGQTTIEK